MTFVLNLRFSDTRVVVLSNVTESVVNGLPAHGSPLTNGPMCAGTGLETPGIGASLTATLSCLW